MFFFQMNRNRLSPNGSFSYQFLNPKEFQIDEIMIIFILMKILIGDQHLGTNDFSILFLSVFILWLGRNSLFQF